MGAAGLDVDIKWDAEKRIILARVAGPASVTDYAARFKAFMDTGEAPPDANTVWDLRDLDFHPFTSEVMEEYVATRSEFEKRRGKAEIAFVVRDEMQLRMLKLMLERTAMFQRNSRVFFDIDEAVDWAARN